MVPPYRAASFLKLCDSSFQPQRSTINNSFNFLTYPTRINQNPTRWKNQSSFDGLVCLCRSCRDIIIKLKYFQLKVPCSTLKWGQRALFTAQILKPTESMWVMFLGYLNTIDLTWWDTSVLSPLLNCLRLLEGYCFKFKSLKGCIIKLCVSPDLWCSTIFRSVYPAC